VWVLRWIDYLSKEVWYCVHKDLYFRSISESENARRPNPFRVEEEDFK